MRTSRSSALTAARSRTSVAAAAGAVLQAIFCLLTGKLASKAIVQTNKNAVIAFVICIGFVFTIIELSRSTNVWVAALSSEQVRSYE